MFVYDAHNKRMLLIPSRVDVFASPEKFNMAVTESDLDLKVRKMSITF